MVVIRGIPQGMNSGPLETYMNMISGPVGQGSLFQHQIMHYDPVHTSRLTDRLHELGRFPVQLIWGADDAWQVSDWAHQLNKAIPGSSLHILDECGHLVPEDQPEILSKLIIDHLSTDSQQVRVVSERGS